MISLRRSALALCSAFVLARLAVAQAPAPANELAAVRTRTPTDADRRTIAQWIAGRIEAAMKPSPDLAAFRGAFLGEFRAAGATEPFKQAFADLSAEACAKLIADPASGQGSGALVCGMLLGVLADMGRPSAMPAALEGLKSKAEFVRERAATCLLRIHERIPAADMQRAFDALAAAAGKEWNGVVLIAMYKALYACGKPEDATKAVLAVLGARVRAYQKRDLRGCMGDIAADELLAETFTARRAQIAAETLRLGVRRLAELLTVAVLNYKELSAVTGSSREQSRADLQRLALLIDATERALAKATNTDPQKQSVAEQMKGPETGRVERMQAALDRWIGTPQKPGVLSQAFNVPAGLPDIRLMATATGSPSTRRSAAPAARS
ncbi:MAG: hypothetical protein ACPMAQ_12670 [Phycisphaerae bacterium]